MQDLTAFIGMFIHHSLDKTHSNQSMTEEMLMRRRKMCPTPAVDDSNKISFYPVSSYEDLPEDFELSSVRQRKAKMMKPGRFIGTLLEGEGYEFSDELVKEFAEDYQRKYGNPWNNIAMELWSNVRAAYDTRNYKEPENESELYGSCMNDKLDLLEFWEMIGLQCLVALDTEDGSILGRALVWSGVKDHRGNEYTFMDRVYTYSQKVDNYFLDYCHQRGWLRRDSFKSGGDSLFVNTAIGETMSLGIQYPVQLDVDMVKGGGFPYSDTIKYISNNLDNLNNYGGIGELGNTDGEGILDPDTTFDVDGNLINLEEDDHIMYLGDIYPTNHPDVVEAIVGSHPFREGFSYSTIHSELAEWSDTYEEYVLETEAVHVEDEDDYVHQDDVEEDKDETPCFHDNLIRQDIYDNEPVSIRLAEYNEDLGAYVYPDDVEEEELEDIDQSGNTVRVPTIDDRTIINDEVVEIDEVVVYQGEVYNMKVDNISRVVPAKEVADGIV